MLKNAFDILDCKPIFVRLVIHQTHWNRAKVITSFTPLISAMVVCREAVDCSSDLGPNPPPASITRASTHEGGEWYANDSAPFSPFLPSPVVASRVFCDTIVVGNDRDRNVACKISALHVCRSHDYSVD